MGYTRRYLMKGALRQIWRYKLRSTLVICCAALGVAGATSAVNYASGGRQQILEQIQRLGTNLVIVSAEQSRNVAGRARTGTIVTTLREPDYIALRREITGLSRSSALVSANLRLKAGYLSKASPVIGVEPDFFPIKYWNLDEGSFFGTDAVKRSARVALLGYQLARDLFEANSPVGERLFINRVPFEVIGVLAERGQGLGVTNEDQQIYVPLTAAMRRLLNRDYYNSILFELDDFDQMDRAELEIAALLRVRHRISAARPDDFKVQSQKELINTQIASADRLGFLVRWIGFSALVVSGLGILAIAWIAVRDRTNEIGTRRALGATTPDIFFQFTFEATFLASIGVATGFVLGWLVSRLIADWTGMPFVFDLANATFAAGVAFVLNLLFVSWPALRAAHLDPIRALKHE